jgi:hypothetical protein
MAIRSRIAQQWKSGELQRSSEQINHEQWLIPGLQMLAFNRYHLLPAAFFIQVGISYWIF